MKILHSADWHLGKLFNNQSLLEDQAILLAQVEDYLAAERPDVLLLAGDVFDRTIPPEGAVALLDRFLSTTVIKLKIPVVLIAGNHDSAERLQFGAGLLGAAGLHMTGRVSADPQALCFHDEHGPVYVYPLPYASPAVVRDVLQDAAIVSHDDAMRALLERIKAQHPPAARSVIVAHAFVAGGEESESERLLSVGGSGAVSSAHFQDFDYVALGHLHKPQQAGAEHIRYAGSLLKYSFSEIAHQKSMTLVSLDAGGFAGYEEITFQPHHDVSEIDGILTAIIEQADNHPQRNDYLRVVLRDSGTLLDPMAKLRQVFPHVLELRRERDNTRLGQSTERRDFRGQEPVALFRDFFRDVAKQELTPAQEDIIRAVVADVKKAHES